jgi:FkbM family methyltransferase
MTTVKKRLRRLANALGLDVMPANQSPRVTYLGIDRFGIDTLVDVGSNTGQFAKQFLKRFPSCRKAYCFEPLPAPFAKLAEWAASAPGDVECFRLALGECIEKRNMYLHVEHDESSSLLSTTEYCSKLFPMTDKSMLTEVEVSTLDQVLLQRFQGAIVRPLLKLDVQGFELNVLKGGLGILHQCKAVLLEVSIDKLYHNQADFLTLTQFLSDNDFRYAGNFDQALAPDGHVVFLDALYVKDER